MQNLHTSTPAGQPPQSAAARRPYTAPRLIVHGTLAELTTAQGLPNTQLIS